MVRESERKYSEKTKNQLSGELGAPHNRVAGRKQSGDRSNCKENTLREEELVTAAIIEEMSDGVVLVNMDGKVTYVNSSFQKLVGYNADALIGTSVVERLTFHESVGLEKFKDVFERIKEKGGSESVDICLINKDGKEILVNSTFSAIKDAQGKSRTAVAFVRDITEHEQVEEALRESEELSRGMLETAATGIYVLQDRTFQYVNHLFEKISGYTSDELIGTHSLDYVHPEDRETVRAKAIEVLKEQSSLPYEFRFIRKNADVVWVLDWVSSIHYRGKRSVLGALSDITERKRAELEVSDYTKQLETLFNIGAAVSQTLNLAEMLDSVLERVLQVMEVESGGIFLLDKQTNELLLRAHRVLSVEHTREMDVMDVGEGVADRAARSGKPVIVEDVSVDPRLTRMVLKGEGFQSLAAIPIMAKERLLGVMNIVGRTHHGFSDREVRLLGTIANQIGMATENAQLYEQAMELAFTDALTGLYNRRYIMEQIERELTRAERSKVSLSVIMIDLDGLKAINDRFGHHEGDAFLKELGRIIKLNTRASDVAARWGGDEFMLLTPETGSKSACRIGERIRSQVGLYRPKIDGEEQGMSVSVGIASFPAHASEVTELLQRVDEAMYSAKRGGKNRLCVFRPRRDGQ